MSILVHVKLIQIHLKTLYMKKQTFQFILLLTIGLFFTQCSEESRAKAFLEVQVKAANLQCPKKLDYMTTLDKCEVTSNRSLSYILTVDGDLGSENTEKVEKQLKENLINNLKSMTDIQKFRDHKINIEYLYNDTKGNKLFQINIAPDEY